MRMFSMSLALYILAISCLIIAECFLGFGIYIYLDFKYLQYPPFATSLATAFIFFIHAILLFVGLQYYKSSCLNKHNEGLVPKLLSAFFKGFNNNN